MKTREENLAATLQNRRKSFLSFLTGAAVGILGGLIGLGGAEFRLPLLLTFFGYATLAAVVMLLAAAGCLAAWLPARRAASIDPVAALRAD